jgi:hypothetical protein
MIDPYSGSAKLVLYTLVALAFVGALTRWKYAEGALRKSRGEVARLEADASARAKNADIARIIAGRVAGKAGAAKGGVAKVNEEVRRASTGQVPKECENAVADAFAPVDAALRGVFRIESESDGASAADTIVRASGADSEAHRLRPEREGDLRRGGGGPVHHGYVALR